MSIIFSSLLRIYIKQSSTFHKGGKGFYDAGEKTSAAGVSQDQHKQAANETFIFALTAASSGDYDLIVCDEINNAVHDGLLDSSQLRELIEFDKSEHFIISNWTKFSRRLARSS